MIGATFRPAADVAIRPIDDELVLLDRARSRYFALTPSGALVWTTIASDGTVADAVARVVEAFEVTPDVAEQDVKGFIADLIRAALLETVAG